MKLENNPKPFWNYTKSLRKGINDLVLLREGEKEITEEYSIAQEMNSYFASVFTQEQSNLPEFDNLLEDKLSNILCNANEVEKHLKELNVHKSQGPDWSHHAYWRNVHKNCQPHCARYLTSHSLAD